MKRLLLGLWAWSQECLYEHSLTLLVGRLLLLEIEPRPFLQNRQLSSTLTSICVPLLIFSVAMSQCLNPELEMSQYVKYLGQYRLLQFHRHNYFQEELDDRVLKPER